MLATLPKVKPYIWGVNHDTPVKCESPKDGRPRG
jgi:hypothetical protein